MYRTFDIYNVVGILIVSIFDDVASIYHVYIYGYINILFFILYCIYYMMCFILHSSYFTSLHFSKLSVQSYESANNVCMQLGFFYCTLEFAMKHSGTHSFDTYT